MTGSERAAFRREDAKRRVSVFADACRGVGLPHREQAGLKPGSFK
jgi:hypothetical protein